MCVRLPWIATSVLLPPSADPRVAFSSWDRVPYWTKRANGSTEVTPLVNRIFSNLLINGYNGVWTLGAYSPKMPSCSLQRALLTLQVNPGSLYRCGNGT